MSATPSELSRVTTEPGTTNYALGHSPAEIRRLGIQAAILRPITMRLLQSLGVSPGMRILDVGCGAGDVALLAAELVGESGAVVGIDRKSVRPPAPDEIQHLLKTAQRYGYWFATPEENASVGITLL